MRENSDTGCGIGLAGSGVSIGVSSRTGGVKGLGNDLGKGIWGGGIWGERTWGEGTWGEGTWGEGTRGKGTRGAGGKEIKSSLGLTLSSVIGVNKP
jgi:hypothetical protein